MPNVSVIRVTRRGIAIIAVITAALLSFGLNAYASGSAKVVAVNVSGNNGTLKIHEQGTPSGTENNDPKVCVPNVEGFFLDAGQTGFLLFSVQGGDGPSGVAAGPFAFGPADASGYFATQYFNLQPGHYKATLYGKQLPGGALTDVKAKSKVFKVICAETPPTTTTTTATTPPSTTTTTATTPPSTTTTTATTPPAVLPPAAAPPAVAPGHPATNPLPSAAHAGLADTSSQLIAGGLAGFLAIAAFVEAFVLNRRRRYDE